MGLGVYTTNGYVEVCIKSRKEIQNHLGSIHAAAMCNVAELAGGTLTEISLPEGKRRIPSAMNVPYLAKAKEEPVVNVYECQLCDKLNKRSGIVIFQGLLVQEFRECLFCLFSRHSGALLFLRRRRN